ncbi:MAG TPA: fumarylacetoacetate hydrolase family protein [Candidatus Limnocylindrales bacterium]|nr:fumarylacetoacetate hydrolase family protein [Candidatus Limnocylindrales bacterium]
MRLATLVEERGGYRIAVLGGDGTALPVEPRIGMRAAAALAPADLAEIRRWAAGRPVSAWMPLDELTLGPAVPDPGAIYTIGLNYRSPGEPPAGGPDRPLIYGKAASSVAADGATLAWDRSLTDNVDAEVELGIVIGQTASNVAPEDALAHVFGWTIINDVSSRDEWLDGDQWLIGKSMPGFCPVGPWVVTADELDPADTALGCTINGEAIQDGRTSSMRFRVAEIVSYLSRHLVLRPGDLIASGTPARLTTPPGPGRRLRPGDRVTCWIEGIGELTTTISNEEQTR